MNMRTRRAVVATLTVAAMLALSACGGASSSAPSPSAGTPAPAAPAAPAEKTAITFAEVGWDSIRFHNAVAGTVAEKVFGYTWSEISGSTPITHEAVIKGEIDVHMETWTDNLATYTEDLAAGRLKELSVNFDDNYQGFYVPRYILEGDPARGLEPLAPDLKHVRDLANYAHLFPDSDNPGKGVIYGGMAGWDITEVMRKKVTFYGLDQMYNYMAPGSDAAMNATILSAYDKGIPIVFYYWEPTWILGMYDFVLLEDEPYDVDRFQEGETACPAVRVMICTSNDFSASNPEFSAFLSKYRTSSALTSEALAYMQENNTNDYVEVAKWFLGEHDELIDAWLTPDQAAKLRAAL